MHAQTQTTSWASSTRECTNTCSLDKYAPKDSQEYWYMRMTRHPMLTSTMVHAPYCPKHPAPTMVLGTCKRLAKWLKHPMLTKHLVHAKAQQRTWCPLRTSVHAHNSLMLPMLVSKGTSSQGNTFAMMSLYVIQIVCVYLCTCLRLLYPPLLDSVKSTAAVAAAVWGWRFNWVCTHAPAGSVCTY